MGETLSAAGAEPPAELAKLMHKLAISHRCPALAGSDARACPVDEIEQMVAGWALVEDDNDVQEVEIEEAVQDYEQTIEQEQEQQEELRRASREQDAAKQQSREQDAASCPLKAQALEAVTVLTRYARHNMSEAAQYKIQVFGRLVQSEHVSRRTRARKQTTLTTAFNAGKPAGAETAQAMNLAEAEAIDIAEVPEPQAQSELQTQPSQGAPTVPIHSS